MLEVWKWYIWYKEKGRRVYVVRFAVGEANHNRCKKIWFLYFSTCKFVHGVYINSMTLMQLQCLTYRNSIEPVWHYSYNVSRSRYDDLTRRSLVKGVAFSKKKTSGPRIPVAVAMLRWATSNIQYRGLYTLLQSYVVLFERYSGEFRLWLQQTQEYSLDHSEATLQLHSASLHDLFFCVRVCLFVCLFVCLSVCLSVCLFVCLFVCLKRALTQLHAGLAN